MKRDNRIKVIKKISQEVEVKNNNIDLKLKADLLNEIFDSIDFKSILDSAANND